MSFWAFVISVITHVGLIGLFFLPTFFSSQPKDLFFQESMPCTIPLEVTAVSDVSCAPISRPKTEFSSNAEPIPEPVPEPPILPEKAPEPIPEPVPEPPILPEKAPEPVPEPVPEPPVLPEKAPEPVPEPIPEPSVLPEKAPEPIPEPKKVKPEPIKKPKTPKKKKEKKAEDKNQKKKTVKKVDPIFDILNQHEKEEKKKKKKTKSSDFISVLKDVDKDRANGPLAETPVTDIHSESEYGAASVGPKMAMSLIDRAFGLLQKAWRVPLGAHDGGDLIVFVNMDMNQDGTVKSATLDHSKGTPNHPAYRVACDSVLRAVDGFRIRPLPLPKEHYEQWKRIECGFNPKKLF